MLQIKTISNSQKVEFDEAVNAAIAEGWELVKRELVICGRENTPILYAELERDVERAEPDDEPEDDGTAEWDVVRDPAHPWRCSACGYRSEKAYALCPSCARHMTNA